MKYMIRASAYLAAGYDQKERMRGYRAQLQATGDITVTSRWLDEAEEKPLQDAEISKDPETAMRYGEMDFEDIDKAEIFVMFTDTPSTSGGRHTELGYAIARCKVIVIVGPQENVFQAYSTAIHLQTWEQLIEFLFGATPES